MPNPNSLLYSFRDLNVHPDGQTGGHAWIDSASDPDQDCIYFMGSETLPSACYILSDESSIPFTRRVKNPFTLRVKGIATG